MKQNFDNNGFRDFEYIAGMDAWARARMFQAHLEDQTAKGQLNYRLPVSSGRGLIECCEALDEGDLITGTFSKTFAHVGGYVVAGREMVDYLKYQSKQHLFSASSSPAAIAISKAIDLIDAKPHWMAKIHDSMDYFRHGLQRLGLRIDDTRSAIFPVRIKDKIKNARICHRLNGLGVYVSQINYPAVSLKDARIRMGVTAAHELSQLDEALNVWADIKKEFKL